LKVQSLKQKKRRIPNAPGNGRNYAMLIRFQLGVKGLDGKAMTLARTFR
jgi:hypothetical protein